MTFSVVVSLAAHQPFPHHAAQSAHSPLRVPLQPQNVWSDWLVNTEHVSYLRFEIGGATRGFTGRLME